MPILDSNKYAVAAVQKKPYDLAIIDFRAFGLLAKLNNGYLAIGFI
jgi:hypothetical protein